MQVVKAAVVSLVISVVCLVPPGIHFVTGPIGPAIGGYIAGSQFKLTSGQGAIVGLVLALLVGIPAPIALTAFGAIPRLATPVIAGFSAFFALWVGLLSGVTAAYAGESARHEESDSNDG